MVSPSPPYLVNPDHQCSPPVSLGSEVDKLSVPAYDKEFLEVAILQKEYDSFAASAFFQADSSFLLMYELVTICHEVSGITG